MPLTLQTGTSQKHKYETFPPRTPTSMTNWRQRRCKTWTGRTVSHPCFLFLSFFLSKAKGKIYYIYKEELQAIIHYHHRRRNWYPGAVGDCTIRILYRLGVARSGYWLSACSECSCRRFQPSVSVTSLRSLISPDRWYRCCRCADGSGLGGGIRRLRGILWIGLLAVL